MSTNNINNEEIVSEEIVGEAIVGEAKSEAIVGEAIVGEEVDYSFTTWDSLEIKPELLRGIYAYGFEQPSPIQMKAIKPIMMKKDVLAQAQSGTGKTATFSIGVLHRVSVKDTYTQALIMSPTHELTTQICGVISS